MTGTPRWREHKAWSLATKRRSRRRVIEPSVGDRHWQPWRPPRVSPFSARLSTLLAGKKTNLAVKLRPDAQHQIRFFPRNPAANYRLWLRLTVNEHPCWLGMSDRLLDDWIPGVGCVGIGQLPPGYSQSIFEKILTTLQAALPGRLIAGLRFQSALALPPVEQPAGSITFWCGTKHAGGSGCLALSEALLVPVLQGLETLPDNEQSWWKSLRIAGRLRIERTAIDEQALANLAKDDLWILESDPLKASADWVVDLPGGCELPATIDFARGQIKLDREQLRPSQPPDDEIVTIDTGPIGVTLGPGQEIGSLPASLILKLRLSRSGQKIATGRWVELHGRAAVRIDHVSVSVSVRPRAAVPDAAGH